MIEVSTGKPVWALGLMSGTSMDGVDAALVLTDGEEVFAFGSTAFHTLTETERGCINAAIDAARRSDFVAVHDDDGVVDQAHLAALGPLMNSSAQRPVVVGYPGQTVAHDPANGITIQIGNGDRLAQATGLPVVWDFRSMDVAASGEGAPLAPFYHFAMAQRIGAAGPLAFLNIGGVANVTWIDPAQSAPEDPGALLAFDTGPGCAVIDDFIAQRTGAEFDADGATAAKGEVDRSALGPIPGFPYLERMPPKSLDRNHFHSIFRAVEGLSTEDGAATLTAFTADCVADSLRHLPSPPTRWLVCGGGRKNRTLMGMLSARLDAPVEPVEAAGLDGDMLEAQAFAYLAVRVLRGLPSSAPSTTGCRQPVCGGRISYP